MNVGVAASATPVIVNYLKKKFPFEPQPDKYPPFEELHRRYGKLHIFLSVLVLPMVISAGVIVFYVLQFLNQHTIPNLPGALYIIPVDPLSFILPSIFLGMVGGTLLMFLITWLILRDRGNEYYYYQSYKDNADFVKILKLLNVTIGVPFVLFAALMMDYYAAVYGNGLEVNYMFSLGAAEYRYSDVETVKHEIYEDEQNNPLHYYTVEFKNGDQWRPTAGFLDYDPDLLKEMMSFIAKSSDKSLVAVEKKE